MKEKKNTEEKKMKVHKVRIKPEPIWMRTSYIGKYNGIRFRFEYKEYNNDDAEEVIKVFKFIWPGTIPEDKEYAEKGIKTLFTKRLDDNTIGFRVIKEDINELIDLSEIETNELVANILEQLDKPDEIIEDEI